MTFTVKSIYTKSLEIYRFTLPDPIEHSALVEKIRQLYKLQTEDQFIMKYVDDENDYVTITSTEDLQVAVNLFQETRCFKLFVFPMNPKDKEIWEPVHPQDARSLSGDQIRGVVRSTYARYASEPAPFYPKSEKKGSCCKEKKTDLEEYAAKLGYSSEELSSLAGTGANLGLGCGNPTALATLKPGEHVLDLGCGGGFDVFLAVKKVGTTGKVVGIDMTPEMIALAKQNAAKSKIENVDFIQGTIEELPFESNTFDVVISNCVINLSADKQRVLNESFRVLRPGGRFVISDVIATQEIPDHIRKDLALYTGCMAGATPVPRLTKMMTEAGFTDVRIEPKMDSKSYIGHWAPGTHAEDYVASAIIFGAKK